MSVDVRLVPTGALTTEELDDLRELCEIAFREREGPRASRGLGFTDEDWAHATGGMHALALERGRFVSHAAVVARELHAGGVAMRTGYVEAVATRPERQHRGFGTAAMEAAALHMREAYELGALDTSRHGFYERLGWERWLGPSSVRTGDGGSTPTPEEDGYVMILRTPSTLALDLAAPISCEWRAGDVW